MFITFCKRTHVPFSNDARDIIMDCCLRGNGEKFLVHAAVVMPDHVHLLLTPLRDPHGWPYLLSDILKLIKGASARSINKMAQRTGQVWQHESFDRILRSEESQTEKLEYIRLNPVRGGLVEAPKDYPWFWEESKPQPV